MRRLGSWAGSKTKADLNGRVESRLDRDTSPDEVSSAFRSLAMLHMDFEEITQLHNRIAFALRMAGLKRAAFDDAIAAAFDDVARAIEDQRVVEWERGKNVRNGFWRGLIAKRDVETYASRTLSCNGFLLTSPQRASIVAHPRRSARIPF